MTDPKQIEEWKELGEARGWYDDEDVNSLRDAVVDLLAERDSLLSLLRESHDAMVTWFSSEYAEHALAKRVAAALRGKP